MGSKAIQGHLWGQNPKDWATIQEPTGNAGYTFVLNKIKFKIGETLLDVGCGSGIFSNLVAGKGVTVTGIDASKPLLDEAKERNPIINFLAGEMEELPFSDNTFDFVCGFNSFQYAANTKNALTEAFRVLKAGGNLVAMIWGNKEDCETATYLKAISGLLPSPLPGAPGPFALSENHLLENILQEIGFKIIINEDIDSIWDYADTGNTIRGLMSIGPAAKAIENSGFQKVHDTVLAAVQPYIQGNGHVVYKNKFRVVIAQK
jgi:ubiquinone/menaquinone biosynthesis C-methylase UbiE